MTASPFDSPLFARLIPTKEATRLFSASAEVRAMMLVEGALAKVQGEQGIIPEDSAFFIHRAAMELQVDPAGLAEATGQNGVPVPGLVAAFRKAMEAPEHAQYMHWGATSQDIADTGLMLRLRQLLALLDADLTSVLNSLAEMAETHADLPMPARTWGQHATVTSFGAQVSEWGAPLLELYEALQGLRNNGLLVSLSGAAGTSGALGDKAAETRALLAKALGLRDPQRSWHVDRQPVLRIADWLSRVCVVLGKLGEDLTALLQSGVGELRLGVAGASSTMPQKQNPVMPSTLVALGRVAAGAQGTLLAAGMPRHQRDAAAWMTEWFCLPQLAHAAAASLALTKELAPQITPQKDAMSAALGGLGLIHAEALSFALAAQMPRPDAQAATKALCRQAQDSATSLADLVAREYPDLDVAGLFDPDQQMGRAPKDARAFATRVRETMA